MINYIAIYQGIFLYTPKETVCLIFKDVDKVNLKLIASSEVCAISPDQYFHFRKASNFVYTHLCNKQD